MSKLRGKAKHRARAKARQQRTVGLAHDTMLANLGAKLMSTHSSGSIGFAHLEPVKIITDTKDLYHAVFKDSHGEYDFSIEHKSDGYHVLASGMPRGPFTSIEAVLWEFEVQLSTHGPRILQGRTYQGRGSFSWSGNNQEVA